MRTHSPTTCSPIRLAGLALSLAGLIALAACSAEGSGDSAATTTRPTATTDRTTTTDSGSSTTDPDDEPGPGDPGSEADCPARADIEDLLGAPVDQITAIGSSMGDVSYSSQGCKFDRTDDKGSLRIVRLTSESGSDADLYGQLEDEARADSEENGFVAIDGLGDDAYRDGRDVAVLDGDHLLFVGFTPTEGEDDPAQARKVAEAVLGTDWPTDIECDPIGETLADEFGPVETAFGGGGTTIIDDVTIQYDQCIVEFADGTEAQVGVAPGDQWDAWVAASKASGFTVNFEEVSVGELAAFDDGENLFVDDSPLALRITTEDLESSPAEQAALRLAAAELAVSG